MKTFKLLLLTFGIIIAVAIFSTMIKVDDQLWEHVANLTQICLEDELIIKVTKYRIYNGISEYNGKYSLLATFTMIDGRNYLLPEAETIDSLIKYKNSPFITVTYEDSTQIRVKGIFRCAEKGDKKEDSIWD